MTNFFKSAEERYTPNAQTLEIKDDTFIINNTEGKKCKIVLNCENAKILRDHIATKLEESNKKYTDNISQLFSQSWKDNITNLDLKNDIKVVNVVNSLKNIPSKYNDYKKERDNLRNESIKIERGKTQIKGNIYIKGIANPHEGHITKINIGKKTVTFKYKDAKDKDETLENIEIGKLCITGCPNGKMEDNIVVVGGSHNYTQGDKNYKFVCE